MRVLGIPYTDEVKQAETLRQEFVVEEEQFFDQQDSEEDIEELDEEDESSESGEEGNKSGSRPLAQRRRADFQMVIDR